MEFIKENLGTIIVVAILAVIVIFAFKSSLKHMKGQGGCCGGGSDSKPVKKKLSGKIIAKKIVTVEGMHCEHCKNSVEGEINKIDGALAKVNLSKGIAMVSMTKDISDDDIRSAVKKAGFNVTSIDKVGD